MGFYGHWALHTKWLYAPIHKKHHEWKSTVALASSYSNPIEFVLTGAFPGTLVQILIRPHVTSIWIYRLIYNFYTLNNHSGYHLPFLPSSESHDYHHAKFNRSIEFVRHQVLHTIKSARELFPDD